MDRTAFPLAFDAFLGATTAFLGTVDFFTTNGALPLFWGDAAFTEAFSILAGLLDRDRISLVATTLLAFLSFVVERAEVGLAAVLDALLADGLEAVFDYLADSLFGANLTAFLASCFLEREVEAFLRVGAGFLGSGAFLLTTEALRRGGLATMASTSFFVAFLMAASFFVLAFSSRRLKGLASAFFSLV